MMAHEMGIFVGSVEQLPFAQAAEKAAAGLPYNNIMDERMNTTSGHLSICSMHLAKGLEFRAVAVMACDDEVIQLASRIENVVDDSDLEEVYNTERHLLYVASTRARDFLLVTGTNPSSEFLDGLTRQNRLSYSIRVERASKLFQSATVPAFRTVLGN